MNSYDKTTTFVTVLAYNVFYRFGESVGSNNFYIKRCNKLNSKKMLLDLTSIDHSYRI